MFFISAWARSASALWNCFVYDWNFFLNNWVSFVYLFGKIVLPVIYNILSTVFKDWQHLHVLSHQGTKEFCQGTGQYSIFVVIMQQSSRCLYLSLSYISKIFEVILIDINSAILFDLGFFVSFKKTRNLLLNYWFIY